MTVLSLIHVGARRTATVESSQSAQDGSTRRVEPCSSSPYDTPDQEIVDRLAAVFESGDRVTRVNYGPCFVLVETEPGEQGDL